MPVSVPLFSHAEGTFKYNHKSSGVFCRIQMDPATAQRAQDVGPSLDSPKASKFLDFWGSKVAEKTRFQVCPCAIEQHMKRFSTLHARMHTLIAQWLMHLLSRASIKGHNARPFLLYMLHLLCGSCVPCCAT